MESAAVAFDAAKNDAISGDVDGAGAARRAERAGVEDDETGRCVRHAAAMRVSHGEKTGGELVLLDEMGGAPRSIAPGAEDAEDAAGRPDGVLEEAEKIAQPVRIGVMALGNGVGGATERGQERVELRAIGGGESGEFTGDELAGERGVTTPRDEIVEQGVAMRDEKCALEERVVMDFAEVGVVVAREDRGGRGGVGEEMADVGEEGGGVGRVG